MLRATLIVMTGLTAFSSRPMTAQGPNGSELLDLSQVDEQPKRVGGRSLRYPPLLLAAGVEGQVLVRYVINADGRADRESIEILESEGRAFTQAATDFVMSGRFQPAKKNGRAVRVSVEQLIRFDARNVGST